MADINLNFGDDDLKRVMAEIQKAARNLEKALKKTGTTLDSDLKQAKEFAKATNRLGNEKKK